MLDIVSEIQNIIDQNKVVVFSTSTCPHCDTAKKIFQEMNIDYEVVQIDRSPYWITGYKMATNHRTVPCIYVNNQKIGGCSELRESIECGEFDGILKAADIKYSPYVIPERV